jgi:hypothetical protein
MQQLYYLMRNPTEVALQFRVGEWIDWVFALKQPDGRRHLLEFVEGWSAARITATASVPLVASVVAGTAWSAVTGDVVTALTFATFLLTFESAFLAILAIVSTIG